MRVLFEADARAPWATLTERAAPLWTEEVVEVFVDPVGDGLGYFEVEINPLGTVTDLVLRRTASGWRKDFAWNVDGLASHVRRTEEGWVAELSIPFDALGAAFPQSNGTRWRVNFLRIRPAGRSPAGNSANSVRGRRRGWRISTATSGSGRWSLCSDARFGMWSRRCVAASGLEESPTRADAATQRRDHMAEISLHFASKTSARSPSHWSNRTTPFSRAHDRVEIAYGERLLADAGPRRQSGRVDTHFLDLRAHLAVSFGVFAAEAHDPVRGKIVRVVRRLHVRDFHRATNGKAAWTAGNPTARRRSSDACPRCSGIPRSPRVRARRSVGR